MRLPVLLAAFPLAACSREPSQEQVLADLAEVAVYSGCRDAAVLEAIRTPTETKALIVLPDACVTRWQEAMASTGRCASPDDPGFYMCSSADGARSAHVDLRSNGRVLVRLGAA